MCSSTRHSTSLARGVHTLFSAGERAALFAFATFQYKGKRSDTFQYKGKRSDTFQYKGKRSDTFQYKGKRSDTFQYKGKRSDTCHSK